MKLNETPVYQACIKKVLYNTLPALLLPAFLLIAGPVHAQFAGGSGTAVDLYQIETLEQFQTDGEPGYLDKHLILDNDIDAGEVFGWSDNFL